MNIYKSKKTSPNYLSILLGEVDSIRMSRAANERQFRCLIAVSLSIFVFALEAPEYIKEAAIAFPILAILLSWIWLLSEQSKNEAEDRAIAHLLEVEQDVDEGIPSVHDEEVASYLHATTKLRSNIASIERKLYMVIAAIEIIFVLFGSYH